MAFFSQKNCDRCKTDVNNIRTTSWFTDETICMECSAKESVIKRKLRAQGMIDAMEGCGFIPTVIAEDKE